MKKINKKSSKIKPGGIDKYIALHSKDVQLRLKEIRAAILEVAPDAIETMSYFDIPGYSYDGYEYNGMFAWFSFKTPSIRLHVRPQALIKYKKEVEKFKKTKAIICFASETKIPKSLVKRLVRESLKDMKEKSRV